MTKFLYKATSLSGATLRGEYEAPSKMHLANHLRSKGYYLVSAKSEPNQNIFDLIRDSLERRVPQSALATATRQLSDLLLAGLELDRALAVMTNLRGAKALQHSFTTVREKVRNGTALADALGEERSFPKFYVGMVRAGEIGGALGQALRKLSDYLTRSAETRATILSALIYPCILLVTAAVSISFVLGFVIPSFAPLFAASGQQLPLPTRIALGLSAFFQNFWWLLLIVLMSSFLWLQRALKNNKHKRKLHANILRVPLVGALWIDIEIERFLRILGSLIASGVPLPTAVMLTGDVIYNVEISASIRAAALRLREGDNLSRLLTTSTFFPPTTLDLIRIGEETGRLDEMLIRQADLDEIRIRQTIDRLVALLVPALTIALGVVVAALIASMLMAILGVNNLAFQ